MSFRRDDLDRFLVASDSVLVRMFEFTLADFSNFKGWSMDPEEFISEGDDVFRRKIDASAAYARGVQIIRPSLTKGQLASFLRDDGQPDRSVDFLAHDFRHGRLATVSTDPSATTNYFMADENDLPFGTSPAFFRPDVLSKYKSDATSTKWTKTRGSSSAAAGGA